MIRRLILLTTLLMAAIATAQDSPHFVTYDHHLEDKGDLEISTQTTIGVQKHGAPAFGGQLFEFEYGATNWWTTSLYLEGAKQQRDAAVFTGFRLENRFRPLRKEHLLNPVLYFEFEDINEASRIQKEVLGHAQEGNETLSELRGEQAREVEAKLIVSTKPLRHWTLAGNFAVEKNLSNEESFEFGYALGAYRSLAGASHRVCRLCLDSLTAGLELYGGLGTADHFGSRDTAQYLAPGIVWRLSPTSTIKMAPSFGLTRGSSRMLFRIGYSFEIEDFGPRIAKLLH